MERELENENLSSARLRTVLDVNKYNYFCLFDICICICFLPPVVDKQSNHIVINHRSPFSIFTLLLLD